MFIAMSVCTFKLVGLTVHVCVNTLDYIKMNELLPIEARFIKLIYNIAIVYLCKYIAY
jgi:hypothetical protein